MLASLPPKSMSTKETNSSAGWGVVRGGWNRLLVFFLGGDRCLMTCEVHVSRRLGSSDGRLTSISSMRMASRSWQRNSCASCCRKSRYWSYFFPSTAKRSLRATEPSSVDDPKGTHLGLMFSRLRLFWMSHAVRSTATRWSPIGSASDQG